MRLEFAQESVTILQTKAKYQKARLKLTNTQLNKLNCIANISQEQYQK